MTDTLAALPWDAPNVDGPVRGAVSVPGSKSMTNRAFVCAALAAGTSRIRRPLISRDSALMSAGLASLGARFETAATDVLVTGSAAQHATRGDVIVDVGLAGTVARFLPPVAALSIGSVHFDGDAQMRKRPMAALIAGLRALGADVDDGGRSALPFVVRGSGRVRGGRVAVDAAQSSQLVSGLLLAAPYFSEGIDLETTGDLPSAPHVAMTVAMMRRAGADIEAAAGRWRVAPGGYDALDVDIEPDVMNASYFVAAAAVTSGSVTVAQWPHDSVQAADQLTAALTSMGVHFEYSDAGLTATGPDALTGVDVDLHDISELTPTVAVLAALASGPSTIRGVAHIRLHETDRLAALASEINGLGGDVRETADGLQIRPRPLHAGRWQTYADHRLAMSGAVLGLAVPGVQIEDIACTSKTMPDFPQIWRSLVLPG